MKSKKLIVLIASIAAVVVVIILLAALFTVSVAPTLSYFEFDGRDMAAPAEGGIAPNDVLEFVKGKSTIFFSKTKLLEQINTTYLDWHAYHVEKIFPNTFVVSLKKRIPLLKIDVNGKEVYIDCFGYAMQEPTSGNVVDATSAFKGTDAKNQQLGTPFKFAVSENDTKLQYVMDALLATWECKVDLDDLAPLLGYDNLFHFDEDGNMLMTPHSGGTIKILSPKTNLKERLQKA